MVSREVDFRIMNALVYNGYQAPQFETKEIMPGIYDVHMNGTQFGIWDDTKRTFID